MKKSYTLNLVKTASDDYIKDIKQAMIDKGIVEETAPDNELDEVINEHMINIAQALQEDY
jgi:hypothetical protein